MGRLAILSSRTSGIAFLGCVFIASCSRVETKPRDLDQDGSIADVADAASSASSPMACPAAPPPANATNPLMPPSGLGCAEFVDGMWHEIPCSCDLWLRNPIETPVDVSLSMTFTPTDVMPSLDGPI